MVEEILIVTAIAVIITLYSLQYLSKKNKKVDVFLHYLLAAGFFISMVFGMWLRPIHISIIWISMCGVFYLWCMYDGSMIWAGREEKKLIRRIFKTKRSVKTE